MSEAGNIFENLATDSAAERFDELLALPGVRIEYAGRIGDGGHVRCVLGAGGARLNAIAFRVADNPVGQALLQRNGLPVHVAGALRVNRWRGKAEVQLQIDDAAPAGLGA